MNRPCPICANQSEISGRFEKTIPGTIDHLFCHVSCPRCGKYFISDDVLDYTINFYGKPSKRKLLNLSSLIRSNDGIYIHQHNVEKLLQTKPDSIGKRAYTLLHHIAENTNFMGQHIIFDINDITIQSKTWSLNSSEVSSLLEYWESKSVLTITHQVGIDDAVCITPHGWSYIDELDHSSFSSSQGFVAMWFDPEMNTVYEEAIKPAIESSGYNSVRVDQHEHNNDITDELIALIRRSKFVIADYTGHRGGVYYEAGFARGLGLEVFMTCRKDHMKDLHFDVNHRICIEWTEDNLRDLKKQLANKIEATLGRGPIIHDA